MKEKDFSNPVEVAIFIAHYNEWRRGGDIEHPHPKELGLALDAAVVHLLKIKDLNVGA